MSKLVILKIYGDFNSGFVVILQIESDGAFIAEIDGRLSPAPIISEQYDEWKSTYSAIGLEFMRVIEPIKGQITNLSIVKLARELKTSINQWLNESGREFQPIRDGLLYYLKCTDDIRFIIKTSDQILLRIPWHLWDIFERYPKAEITIASPHKAISKSSKKNKKPVRILVILGLNSDGNFQADLEIIKNKLPDAYIFSLIATSRDKLDNELWSQEWDIMFFAGHSSTSELMDGQGKFFLNETESITIEQLKYSLQNAIANGLKLAIFNSCDGLGLAQDLADLQIPAIIVMRERIQDAAAQRFLEFFLEAFATKGKVLSAAVREARERLYGLENRYPCASWLPLLCQHQNTEELTWMGLRKIENRHKNSANFTKWKFSLNWPALLLVGLGCVGWNLGAPKLARTINNVGYVSYLENRVYSAWRNWQLARKINPENPVVFYNQGWICEDVQDFDCAKENYKLAAERGLAAAYSNLSRLYILKDKDYGAAVSLLWQGLKQVEQDPVETQDRVKYALYKNLGWARLEQGRYLDASAHLEEAISLDSDRASAYCLLAQVKDAQEEVEEAIANWKTCLNLSSQESPDEDVWIGIGRQRLQDLKESYNTPTNSKVESTINDNNTSEIHINKDGAQFSRPK